MKIKPNHFWSTANDYEIINTKKSTYTVRNNRSRYLFPDEYMAIEDVPEVAKHKRLLLYRFLINTGARINEIRHVQVQDIDFERNSIILRKTKVRNKDGSYRPRILPISTKFCKYLKKVIKDQNLMPNDYFPVMNISGAHQSLKRSLQRAGIPDWKMISIHNLRKTLETWLIALGIDSMKITQHFGHSYNVAIKHYVSPDTFTWEEKKQIREIIGGLYER